MDTQIIGAWKAYAIIMGAVATISIISNRRYRGNGITSATGLHMKSVLERAIADVKITPKGTPSRQLAVSKALGVIDTLTGIYSVTELDVALGVDLADMQSQLTKELITVK